MFERHALEEPKVTIVVPAMNEARNLEVMLPQLPQVHQIIVVDGHSVDDTVQVAQTVRPEVEVITQTRRGKGNALACGFERATGDIVVMFDADGSADPAEIPAFISALVAGADVAKGSRFIRGGGSEDITRIRRAGNWGLNKLVDVMIGARYTDLCYGYNAFWTRLLPDLKLPSTRLASDEMIWGDGFEIETVLNCRFAILGLGIAEVPSFEKHRIFGRSNLNAISDGLRVLRTVLDERRRAAGRRVAPATITQVYGDAVRAVA